MIGIKVLEERESKCSGHIKVLKSFLVGNYIQCNGLTQSGGIVESIWKSTLNHISYSPLTIHNILILGLGGGTLAKLLRKKYPDAKITGVEIDPIMIEMGKKYLDLDKYNVDIKIMDARKFKIKKYDLVIVDGYIGDKYIDLIQSDISGCNLVIFNRIYLKNQKFDIEQFKNKLEKMFKKVEIFRPQVNLMFFCYN